VNNPVRKCGGLLKACAAFSLFLHAQSEKRWRAAPRAPRRATYNAVLGGYELRGGPAGAGPPPGPRCTLGRVSIDPRKTYRAQLDRVRRFLTRLQGKHASYRDFEDMGLAFVQNCWHLYDWVEKDAAIKTGRGKVLKAARASVLLKIAHDVCNGAKHLTLTSPLSGAGASAHHTGLTIFPGQNREAEWEFHIEDGNGHLISGQQAARDCIAEWESMLKAAGLDIRPLD
jgi:hypothetical protein